VASQRIRQHQWRSGHRKAVCSGKSLAARQHLARQRHRAGGGRHLAWLAETISGMAGSDRNIASAKPGGGMAPGVVSAASENSGAGGSISGVSLAASAAGVKPWQRRRMAWQMSISIGINEAWASKIENGGNGVKMASVNYGIGNGM
jgi:hypothetical protein